MSDPALLALTALLLPAVSFLVLAIVAPLRRHGHAAAYLSVVLSAASLVAAVAAWRVSAAGGFTERLFTWIPADAGPLAVVGVLADGDSTLTPSALSKTIRQETMRATGQGHGPEMAVSLTEKLTPTISRIEREMIKTALRANQGRAEATAKALGISRKGLYLKRQRLGV